MAKVSFFPIACLWIGALAALLSVPAEAGREVDVEHAAEASTLPWAGVHGVTPTSVRSRYNSGYPELARKARIGASLIVQVVVRRDGSVEVQELLGCRVWKWGKKPDEKRAEHCPALFEVLSSDIERWKIDPAKIDGRPVDAFDHIELVFSKKAGSKPVEIWTEAERQALLPPEARESDDAGGREAPTPVRQAAALPPDEPWLELRTNHFTVYSNASEESASRMAMRLEVLREVLRRLHGGDSVRSPRPTLVYMFRHEASFAPYTTGENVAGYFVQALDANYVALYSSLGYTRAIYHEYLHYFLANNLPHVPLWLNEGIAELYETFDVRGDTVEVGRRINHHISELRRRDPMPLAELFAVTTESEAYNESERKGLFYAQSWALVHYLVLGEQELTASLIDFVQRLGRGEAQGAAFDAAFEMSHETLLDRLSGYLASGSYPMMTIKFSEFEWEKGSEVRRLSRPEALAHLGRLLAYADREHPEGAIGHFRAALGADPELAIAHRGLGLVHKLQRKTGDALASLDEAIRLAPDDDLAIYLRGSILLEQAQEAIESTGASDPELLAAAERSLRRAVELNPRRADSWRRLGVALANGRSCDEGAEVLKRAWQMMPSELTIAGHLSRLLGMCGEGETARYIVSTFLVPYADPAEAADAERFILIGEKNEIRRLASEEKLDEAREKLDGLLAGYDDPVTRAEIEASLEDVRSYIESQSHQSTYATALEAYKSGRYGRTVELAGSLLADLESGTDQRENRQRVAVLLESATVRVEWNRAAELADAGKYRAAIDLIEAAAGRLSAFLKGSIEERHRVNLTHDLNWIGKLRVDYWRGFYQEAVKIGLAGDRAKAAKLVREVIEQCPDPETVASARRALGELER